MRGDKWKFVNQKQQVGDFENAGSTITNNGFKY